MLLLLMLPWRREKRGTHLPHMCSHTESMHGVHVDHIIILLEIDVGTGKMELKSGRRSWQILLLNMEMSGSCTLVPVLGSVLG